MNVFDLVGRSAEAEKVVCILVGGFALHFHGVDRQTMDVDFLISPDDFAKLRDHLTRGGYRLGESSPLFARFLPTESPKLSIDFLFVDPETVKRIRAEGRAVAVAGREFIVPSLRHMIALKLHAIRQTPSRKALDLADIAALIQRHPAETSRQMMKALCQEHGTPDLFEEVVRLCRL